MPKTVTIFYAWQSDRPRNLCYRFIKEAAEVALKRLQDEHALAEGSEVEDAPDISYELDHDTKGLPGSPKVAEAILRKIDTCDIFLADMTIVASYQTHDQNPRTKKSVNPNVLYEAGYARKARGEDRYVAVQNTAYGTGHDLPFDLQHIRHPIGYVAEPGDAKKREKEQSALSDTLVDAFRTILNTVMKDEQAAAAAAEANTKEGDAAERAALERTLRESHLSFIQRIRGGALYDFRKDDMFVAVSARPATEVNGLPLGPAAESLNADLNPIHLPEGGGSVDRRVRGGLILTSRRNDKGQWSYVELKDDGAIVAAAPLGLTYQASNIPGLQVVKNWFLSISPDQVNIFRCIRDWLRGLFDELVVPPPWLVIVSLHNATNVNLVIGNTVAGKFEANDIIPPRAGYVGEDVLSADDRTAARAVAAGLQAAFDFIYMEAGVEGGDPHVTAEGVYWGNLQ
jgi:hypothetical protein